ncbi:DUF2182 domain-containing protein [Dyella flagellata]|uniref:DUF2182 domain-containing protein n=1 Tax=Dyella flagellata TaxID=1867833 RepID=A0ABQ5XIN9_9GAMM|nr:DUF2182 domain-containing protein [Dyella flagellata]GLQ91029.1 hypothetical protein GCM10007898_46050 [Dyella flagellata]
MIAAPTSERAFFAASAALFTLSATLTIVGCASMSGMDAMPMPGGWSMSMLWVRMPEQTWGGAAASFLVMWDVMMAAMMLPSLVPALQRYRQAVGTTTGMQLELLTVLVGTGYFFAWSVFGMLVFPLGVALATAEMHWPLLARSVPLLAGAMVLLAGVAQFTPWKARQLTRCREALRHIRTVPAQPGTAWRQGMCLGLHCCLSCANLTAIQLVIGVMDLRAMAFVTVAILAERLAPAGKLATKAIGVLAIVAGVFRLT